MMNVVRYAPPQEHASNLGCLLGNALGKPYDKPVIIYDAPSTDEMEYYAKWTGIPEEPIVPANHVLNSRTVSRKVAREMGKEYEDCNFIVCHMGGGIGITAHKKGRIVDAVATDMGPMSPERAGRIPTNIMANLCYSGRYTKAEMKKYLLGGSGILAWLGTQNMLEVENRAKAGEEKVVKVFYTMAYQTAKGIGELAAALAGKVDRIILTGGLARADMFCDWIVELVNFIAPIARVPGEYEMEALAEGGLRVLEGLDVPKEYTVVPRGYKDMDAFYEAFPEMERVGV